MVIDTHHAKPRGPVWDYKRALEWQQEYRDKWYEDSRKPGYRGHPGFNNSVRIIHGDRTIIHFECAFVIFRGGWYFVFTEHNGYHVYHFQDAIVDQFEGLGIDGLWGEGEGDGVWDLEEEDDEEEVQDALSDSNETDVTGVES